MTLSNNDRDFLDGELVIKVENEQQARYLIGLAIIGNVSTDFTGMGDYKNYPYYGVLGGELIGYCKQPTHMGATEGSNLPNILEGRG